MKKEIKANIKYLGLLNLFIDTKFYGAYAIIYFTAVSGSMTLGMSIFSVMMIASSIFELPTGVLSDRIGRKKILVLGTMTSFVSSLLYLISNSYWFLVIAAIFQGLEYALFSGNNEALLYDTLKEAGLEKEYKNYLGKTESMYQLSSVFAVIVGAVLITFTSIKFLMILTLVPKVFGIYIGLKIKDPVVCTNKVPDNPFLQVKEMFLKVKNNSQLKKIMVADTVASCIGEAAYQFRPMFYQNVWPEWAVGIPSLLSNALKFVSNWFAGGIIKKFGDRKVVVIGHIYGLLSNVIGFTMNNFISPFILVSNSIPPTNIAKNALLNEYYSDELRASMASLISLIVTLATSIIMILIGALADNVGIIKALLIVSSFRIITIVTYNNVYKNRDKE